MASWTPMNTRRAAWRRGPAGTLLVVLLLVLGVTGVLAYQAWDAARSHQRVTEATLRDYAGFAASELGRRVEASTHAALNAALTPVLLAPAETGPSPSMALVAFGMSVENALHACGCAHAVSDHFTIDLESMEVQVEGAKLGPEFPAWLADDFRSRARARAEEVELRAGIRLQVTERIGDDPLHRVIVVGTSQGDRGLLAEPPVVLPFDSTRMVVYRVVAAAGRRSVHGFVVDVAELLRPLVEAAVSGPPLLPPALAGAARNEEMLSASAWLLGRDTIFRTGDGTSPGTGVVDTLHLATGPLATRMAVRPEMAGQLVIGGLPRTRVPILLGSVTLTLILLLIAVVQLQRQQELHRLRVDFVSGVSHELRTPLAQIRLFSDLLASGRLDEGQRRRSMRILTDETKRLTYLVENVLRFSRSERRIERLAPLPLDVVPLLREVVEDFAPLAEARGARIELDGPERLRALVDADALRQVLLNLLDNAVKYGPHGQTIRVSSMPEGAWLRIEVDDEGPGVPAAERERIFEPYRRLEREVEGATGGSGIGLAVVRELVALHGGEAFVGDGSRGGSRFVVRLPLAPEPEALLGAEAGFDPGGGAKA